jgi:hypothetical protein
MLTATGTPGARPVGDVHADKASVIARTVARPTLVRVVTLLHLIRFQPYAD